MPNIIGQLKSKISKEEAIKYIMQMISDDWKENFFKNNETIQTVMCSRQKSQYEKGRSWKQEKRTVKPIDINYGI